MRSISLPEEALGNARFDVDTMASVENISSIYAGLEPWDGGEAGRDFEPWSPSESLAIKGEESVDRAVSGGGAGGDIPCTGTKFATSVSNLILTESSVSWMSAIVDYKPRTVISGSIRRRRERPIVY